MSVLQALVSHYDRLFESGEAPEFGYSSEGVSFAVVLSDSGREVGVVDRRDLTGRNPRPKRELVPRPSPSRTGTKVVPNFLWDKTAYALGILADRNTGDATPAGRGEHQAFKGFHLDLLRDTEDPGLRALARFLEQWSPGRFAELPHSDDMLDTNVVFRLDGDREFIHERAEAKRIWRDCITGDNGPKGICLVTGERASIQRVHPKIKRVRGAQSSGASIVSFNEDAFVSHGRKQGDNAPVSEAAAFAYTTALNVMLAPDSGRHLIVGDTTTVFWAEANGDKAAATDAEELFALLAAPPPPTDAQESAAVADTFAAIAEGRPLSDARPKLDESTRFYVLGLAPNSSRLSIRFWHEDTIGAFARRVGEHWRDLKIDPFPWPGPPPIWSLLLETAVQHKAANIPPMLGGQLMRAILTGARYPRSLFASVVARMRADKDVNGRRVAICKACLCRDHRWGFEEDNVPMSLDRDNDNPAYLLGRLFAVYEAVQRAALGQVNATIKDRYWGSASATPASVFPLLVRGSAAHLASLRKGDKGGLAHWFDREIDGILDQMHDAFPRSLRLEEQGRFAIGYHHQRGSRSAKPSKDTDPQTED